MSRMGKKPLPVPDNVKVHVEGRHLSVEGPLGRLDLDVSSRISVDHDAQRRVVTVARQGDDRQARALHGLTRALIQNMVVGVTKGYEKKLEIVGVGYLAAVQQDVLQLRVGFANELQVPIPEGVKVSVPDQQHIVLQSNDKQLLGHFAANVRSMRLPEPYKGKGIKYRGEYIFRKEGKKK